LSQTGRNIAFLVAATIPAALAGLCLAYTDGWKYREGSLEIPIIVFALTVGLMTAHKKTINTALIWIAFCVLIPFFLSLVVIQLVG